MVIYSNGWSENTKYLIAYFIFQTFSIIDFISPTIKTILKNTYVRIVLERVLLYLRISDIVAILLVIFIKNWDEKLGVETVVK